MSTGFRRALACVVVAATSSPLIAAPLSALEPAGSDARFIADLFWWMALGAAALWVAAMTFLIYCLYGARVGRTPPSPTKVVTGGGVIVPVVVLSVLLGATLPSIETVVDGAPPPHQPQVRVVGEQWWWRVAYLRPDGTEVTAANEVRIPRGRRTLLALTSDNVIHSFWVPTLAGKIDMIPGRTTYLSLEPHTTGRFRGICAEYCGTSHARMTFEVVVEEPAVFDAWLVSAAAPAITPTAADAVAGAQTFIESGCGGCHTVRGTAADGVVGPDLTHVAGRDGPAAPLRASTGELVAWLRQPAHRKPGALMPPFASLGEARLDELTAYLRELR